MVDAYYLHKTNKQKNRVKVCGYSKQAKQIPCTAMVEYPTTYIKQKG
jgi:hypothetical protein